MKFRFVLLGPDDDPAARVPPGQCRALRYEHRGADIVRVEQRENGAWKSTTVVSVGLVRCGSVGVKLARTVWRNREDLIHALARST